MRRYLIMRNRAALSRRYIATHPERVRQMAVASMREIVKTVLVERERLMKLLCVAAGIADGLRGRLGPPPRRFQRARGA